jgi:hypothetical protein
MTMARRPSPPEQSALDHDDIRLLELCLRPSSFATAFDRPMALFGASARQMRLEGLYII